MSEVEFIDIFSHNLESIMVEYGINRIELAKEAHQIGRASCRERV